MARHTRAVPVTRDRASTRSRLPLAGLPLAGLLLASFSAGALAGWRLGTYGPPRPLQAQNETLIAGEPTVIEPIIGPAPPSVSSVPSASLPSSVTVAGPREDSPASAPTETPTATTGSSPHSPLRLPIDGMNIESFKGGFSEHRGDRPHEAIDVLAPRNTPVHAVTGGTIAKLFFSKQGGLTIYQFDAEGRLCYYYAHLERYADSLHDGQQIRQGDVIGFVGTSGNSPPMTPHLHFAVFELNRERQWWRGRAIDPYLVFAGKGSGLGAER
jgi:peptidoglycan LD-endopeptidase LytH